MSYWRRFIHKAFPLAPDYQIVAAIVGFSARAGRRARGGRQDGRPAAIRGTTKTSPSFDREMIVLFSSLCAHVDQNLSAIESAASSMRKGFVVPRWRENCPSTAPRN